VHQEMQTQYTLYKVGLEQFMGRRAVPYL